MLKNFLKINIHHKFINHYQVDICIFLITADKENDTVIQIDLMDVSNISTKNKNYKYIYLFVLMEMVEKVMQYQWKIKIH